MGDADDDLSAHVSALPGMDRVLPALEGLPPTYLVGGAVRDLLRGADGVDLDLCVEGDAVTAARALAGGLGGEARPHERFGTAVVTAPGLEVDLAQTRRERYPRPGALPVVEAASLGEDLERRDFTVNAMAVGLSGDDVGRLHDPHGGRADLGDGLVRVLNPRSFVDDPTRLLRAVRYEIRLGARMDDPTERLAREAASGAALATVSGPRVRDALLRLLAEADVAAAVERLRDLGLDRALHPALDADPSLVAGAALGALETGADRRLAALAALVVAAPEELEPWLEGLGLTGVERDRVVRAARRAPEISRALGEDRAASELRTLLDPEPPEALALALGLGAPGEPVLHYLSGLRGVRLEVTGADLLAAGVPESPALGRALDETLRRKLDGEVAGRDEELRVALDLARGEPA